MKKILFLFFIIIALPVMSSKADPPILGIITQDGSRIAIYTQQIIGNKTMFTYYPEDTNELGYDDFYIWISFPPVQNLQHQLIVNPFPANITLSMYGVETRLQAIPNNTTGGIDYKNVTEYTKFLSSKSFSLFAGQNEKGDPTYGILHIDKNNWDVIAPSDDRTKIFIAYNDVILTIWHQTDYSLVPITQTRGEFNQQLYWLIGLYTGGLFLGLFVLREIINKNGKSSPPITLGWALAVVGFLITLYTYTYFTSTSLTTSNADSYVYYINGLKPEYVLLILGSVSDFFIVSMIGNREYGEVHILALNTPYQDSEAIIAKTMTIGRMREIQKTAKARLVTLYYYKTLRNKVVYTYDKDSFWQWWVDLLGGVKFDADEATAVRLVDDDWKKDLGLVYITFDYKEGSKSIIPDNVQPFFNLGIIVLIVGLFITTIQWHFPDVFVSAILITFTGIIWYVNHTLQKQNILIKPMTMTGIAALTLAKIADIIQEKYDWILTKYTHLKNQKDNILTESVNAAREQTWLLATHFFRQTEFADGLPNLYEILSITGLEYNKQTKEIVMQEQPSEEVPQPQLLNRDEQTDKPKQHMKKWWKRT